jgi:hypothetical protein
MIILLANRVSGLLELFPVILQTAADVYSAQGTLRPAPLIDLQSLPYDSYLMDVYGACEIAW